ncbi:MAG: GTPase ObgE [Dehalococcoidales bacterium]|nr:GTPase ObgE [Dehalococcoidales bacterium]
MFDTAKIKVRAGKGGKGAISFRHEKFVPFGGPDGGDGGDGGSVILEASSSVSNLRRYNQVRLYRAGDGGDGMGKKMHGKKGGDLILTVPPGTVVMHRVQDGDTIPVVDLERPGQRVVIARGGVGGLGNVHFTCSTNQAPRIAQEGEVGEEKEVMLEMRLITDVGIIGYPNCGKSTLLAASTAAKPKIADYPFTTLEPALGVIEVGGQSLVLAEIPGLIEGAHLGRGLGHDFLRHITRTRVLIHLVDGSSAAPAEDVARVNAELGLFDATLARKPQLVAVNKIDQPQVRSRITDIISSFSAVGTSPRFISAVTGEGVDELMAETLKMLDRAQVNQGADEKAGGRVFRPLPRGSDLCVHRDGDVFVITAPKLERIIARQGTAEAEVYRYVIGYLERRGIGRELRKLGISSGDKVRCSSLEWYWS